MLRPNETGYDPEGLIERGLDFQVVINNDFPTLEMTLYEGDNSTPLDISGNGVDLFIMLKKPDGSFKDISVSRLGTGTDGKIFHQWSKEDINLVGIYEVEARSMFQGKKYTSLKRLKFEAISSLRGD